MKSEMRLEDLQKKYLDLLDMYNELNMKYGKMSRDIAEMQMKLDGVNRIPAMPIAKHRRDKTLYKFNDRIMTKRDLVLECIDKYIIDNGITNSDEIKGAFPDYIQGPLGVIRSVEEIKARYEDYEKRYFLGKHELVFEDGKFAVSKDWNKGNIDKFIRVAKNLGYDIVPIVR